MIKGKRILFRIVFKFGLKAFIGFDSPNAACVFKFWLRDGFVCVLYFKGFFFLILVPSDIQ